MKIFLERMIKFNFLGFILLSGVALGNLFMFLSISFSSTLLLTISLLSYGVGIVLTILFYFGTKNKENKAVEETAVPSKTTKEKAVEENDEDEYYYEE